jgi:hypothetical protein
MRLWSSQAFSQAISSRFISPLPRAGADRFLFAGISGVLQAQLGKPAMSGAAKIHPGVEYLHATFTALSGTLILKKFNWFPAIDAGDLENGPRIPKPRVLPGALHGLFLSVCKLPSPDLE